MWVMYREDFNCTLVLDTIEDVRPAPINHIDPANGIMGYKGNSEMSRSSVLPRSD